MHRHLALASLIALSLPAAASAGLITSPTSGPIIAATPAPERRPAPPTETVHWLVVDDAGWRLQIGEQNESGIACGETGNIFARISPGQNGPWTYRFVRSDGTSTAPVTVPASPEIGGRWEPTHAPFGKEVEDTTAIRAHVNEWLEVGFAGKIMSSPSQVEVCH